MKYVGAIVSTDMGKRSQILPKILEVSKYELEQEYEQYMPKKKVQLFNCRIYSLNNSDRFSRNQLHFREFLNNLYILRV